MGNTPSAAGEGCYREGRPCDGGLFETVKSTLKTGSLSAQNICCHEGQPNGFETINTRHVYEASLHALNHDEHPKAGFAGLPISQPEVISSWAPAGQVLPAPTRYDEMSQSSYAPASSTFEAASQAPTKKDDEVYLGPEGYRRLLKETRAKMVLPAKDAPLKGAHARDAAPKVHGPGSGKKDLMFPNILKGRHAPVLGLITPASSSSSKMDLGRELLSIARHSPVYQDRFFNTNEMLEDMARGGFLGVLREELNVAKAEALELKTRPRVVVGGDDTTTHVVIWLILKALQANEKRVSEGLSQFKDTGNGFTWTDDELRSSFPAIVQLPLGNQCNLADACGWVGSSSCISCCGRKSKYRTATTLRTCGISRSARVRVLQQLMEAIIDPATPCRNFDVWGVMPPFGADKINFKLCELGAKPGRSPKTKVNGKKGNISLKPASCTVAKAPAPWMVLVSFRAGYGAYRNSRIKANPHSTPFRSRLERWRQFFGVSCEKTPLQMRTKTNGIKVACLGGKGGDGLDHGAHHKAQSYFPPRNGRKAWGVNCWSRGNRYREVGFYNVSCRASPGAERAPLMRRLCFSKRRRPIRCDDGCLHMYRMRFKSYLKNPGRTMQTDRRKDMTLSFEAHSDKTPSEGSVEAVRKAAPAKGLFVQFDGEPRFAFSPTGQRFDLMIRKVMNLPVVIGPFSKEPVEKDKKVEFEIYGDTPEDKEQTRLRIIKSLNGTLDAELHATEDDLKAVNLPVYEAPHDATKGTPARIKTKSMDKSL
mmetsp:Transcript_35111/g.54522  ORF Transcript_35111/g.54522 Transcript_35111/m.54522 type:complete len:763 (-) Transcript_35111:315-2603(-)